ncbi:MAG: hypothetical protein KAI25_03800, partial [Hyphomicrobiaceae bacterium]|nr:hypothetical protein [Hyphomicrobiaceae bacterium]
LLGVKRTSHRRSHVRHASVFRHFNAALTTKTTPTKSSDHTIGADGQTLKANKVFRVFGG